VIGLLRPPCTQWPPRSMPSKTLSSLLLSSELYVRPPMRARPSSTVTLHRTRETESIDMQGAKRTGEESERTRQEMHADTLTAMGYFRGKSCTMNNPDITHTVPAPLSCPCRNFKSAGKLFHAGIHLPAFLPPQALYVSHTKTGTCFHLIWATKGVAFCCAREGLAVRANKLIHARFSYRPVHIPAIVCPQKVCSRQPSCACSDDECMAVPTGS